MDKIERIPTGKVAQEGSWFQALRWEYEETEPSRDARGQRGWKQKLGQRNTGVLLQGTRHSTTAAQPTVPVLPPTSIDHNPARAPSSSPPRILLRVEGCVCRAALGLWVPTQNAAHVSPCPGARVYLGGREVGLDSAQRSRGRTGEWGGEWVWSRYLHLRRCVPTAIFQPAEQGKQGRREVRLGMLSPVG